MFILDSHVHMWTDDKSDNEIHELSEQYVKDLAKAGISGSQVMSPDPELGGHMSAEQRIHTVMEFCKGKENLYPYFWLDPRKDSFIEDMELAYQGGIAGYKIICSGFYPGDENVIAACTKAAELNKPMLFHSGILWDGKDSSRYNRPGEYEALMDVPNLRFCLAHVSWPWTDECIAVYGKFNNAPLFQPHVSCEMFIDITPGTPVIYREEVFKKLFLTGYQVKYNVMFGTDCSAHHYNINWAKEWIGRDVELIKRFNPEDAEDMLDHIYQKNFLRFMGKSDEVRPIIRPDVAT